MAFEPECSAAALSQCFEILGLHRGGAPSAEETDTCMHIHVYVHEHIVCTHRYTDTYWVYVYSVCVRHRYTNMYVYIFVFLAQVCSHGTILLLRLERGPVLLGLGAAASRVRPTSDTSLASRLVQTTPHSPYVYAVPGAPKTVGTWTFQCAWAPHVPN